MIFCKDYFGQVYELAGKNDYISKTLPITGFGDLQSAQQLVKRLAVEPHSWGGILFRLGFDIRATFSHPNQIYELLGSLVARGELSIVRLPEVSLSSAIRGKNDKGVCFIRQSQSHGINKFTPVEISNKDAAKQFIDGLGLARSALIHGLRLNNLSEYAEAEEPHAKLIAGLLSGELQAYTLDLPPMEPPRKNVEYETNPVPGAKPASLAPDPVVKAKPLPDTNNTSSLDNRKGNTPSSLSDASARLASMKTEIATNGHIPKYTDSELMAQAHLGEVANERFHVRFMEAGYLKSRENPSEALGGALGVTMEGKTGKGAKYWSTTFDQIEDADTDAKIISEKLGLEYNPKAEYVLVIVDSQKAIPLTGVKSVSATFANVSEFANTELPAHFPKEFTDKVMNPEFQAAYADQYNAAVEANVLPNAWSKDTKKFSEYLETTDLSLSERDTMLNRMDMQAAVGNNQLYVGNGLTEDVSTNKNKYGAVETLNFERKEVNLQRLKDNDAILILPL